MPDFSDSPSLEADISISGQTAADPDDGIMPSIEPGESR